MTVPCGQCIGCRVDRSQQWATRIIHETRFHRENSFLTLTYADEHIPVGGTLHLPDLQKFMKRLRRRLQPKPLRFFACGEYGEKLQRPHYHLILFGHVFPDRKTHSKNAQGDQTWTSQELTDIWGLGHCLIGSVTWKSAAYTARYILKKINGDQAHEHYQKCSKTTGEIYQLKPEFIVMSRRPGIGAKFFDKFGSDLYPHDAAIVNGRPKRVPRFYDKKLESTDPALHRKIQSSRKARAAQQADNNTPERLAVRQECLESKLTKLKRNL